MSMREQKVSAINSQKALTKDFIDQKEVQSMSMDSLCKSKENNHKKFPIAYNCDVCQDRLMCEECHRKEIEKDFKLMEKLVKEYQMKMLTQPKPIPMTTGSNTLSPSTESDTRSFNYKQSEKKRIKKLKAKVAKAEAAISKPKPKSVEKPNIVEQTIIEIDDSSESVSAEHEDSPNSKKDSKNEEKTDVDYSKIEMIIEKAANKKCKKDLVNKVREEEPTRRSQRVRHKAVTGENFCSLLNGSSIYCEDDEEINGYFCKDENEYILSIIDASRGSSGRRKQKLKLKEQMSD